MTSLSRYLAVFLTGLACLMWIACQPQQRGPSKYQFYTARCEAMSDKDETVYRPVPPDALYLAAEDISGLNELKNASFLYNFAVPDGADMPDTMASRPAFS